MRWGVSVVCALIVGLVPAARDAAAETLLVDVRGGDAAVSDELRDALVERLAAAGEQVVAPEDADAAWLRRIVPRPDADADAAFVAQTATNATGRNLFYESDFDQAIALLEPGLAALEQDPSVLAFHPDLAPAAFDAALTLARAHRARGDEEAFAATLTRAAAVMWAAAPSPADFPPTFVDEFDAVRGLIPTRELSTNWPHEGCTLRVNGFAADVEHETLRLPAGTHYLQLECGDRRSRVVRLGPDRAAARFDLALDDALSWEGDHPVFTPRDDDPDLLRRIAAHAAELLGFESVVSIERVSVDDDVERLELSRLDTEGHAVFRAVRVVVGDRLAPARLHAAVDYLVSGTAEDDGVLVWTAENGWAPIGGYGARPGRRATPWVLGGTAVAAAVVATVFELRTRESLRDVDACADGVASDPLTCDPAIMPALRSDARRARSLATVSWAVAGTAAVTAAVVRWAGHDRSPDGFASSLGVAADRTGARLSATWSW